MTTSEPAREGRDNQHTAGVAPEAPVSAELATAWRQAEAQLYGALMWDPEQYQRAVLLVGRVVVGLRRLGRSSEALRSAADWPGPRVREAADELGLDTTSLDPVLIAQAALAMRLREVVAEQAASRRLSLLAGAAHQGLPWVVLEESGDPNGDPTNPYRRLEAEVATGRALYVTAAPDGDFVTVVHEVTPMAVDLTDGRLGDPDPSGAGSSRHEDRIAREEHADRLRRRSGPW